MSITKKNDNEIKKKTSTTKIKIGSTSLCNNGIRNDNTKLVLFCQKKVLNALNTLMALKRRMHFIKRILNQFNYLIILKLWYFQKYFLIFIKKSLNFITIKTNWLNWTYFIKFQVSLSKLLKPTLDSLWLWVFYIKIMK